MGTNNQFDSPISEPQCLNPGMPLTEDPVATLDQVMNIGTAEINTVSKETYSGDF